MAGVQPGLFFGNQSLGDFEIYVSVILYDSAPVYCAIRNEEQTYDNNLEANNVLEYWKYEKCRPLRILTLASLGCPYLVMTHYVKFPQYAVDPKDVITRDSEKMALVSGIQFTSPSAAADYMWTVSSGYHVAFVARYGGEYLQIPQFSGTYLPFHKRLSANSEETDDDGNAFVNIYGAGWSQNFPFNFSGVGAQVSPFACRPVDGTRDSRSIFQGLVNAVVNTERPISCGPQRDNPKTPINFYRTPFKSSLPLPP